MAANYAKDKGLFVIKDSRSKALKTMEPKKDVNTT